MGRRIPGKKHRGIKYPYVQKAVRDEALKNKVNAPPKEIDFQEVPKSVERIMMLKQLTKEGKFDKPKKKKKKSNNLINTGNYEEKEKILPGMSKPVRKLPQLVQRPGEKNRSFLHRVQRATDDFIKEVNFEVKYNMKMKRDDKTGEVKFDKVELHPVDKMFQDKVDAAKKPKHKTKKTGEGEALSKTAKRKQRKEARKAQRLAENGDEEVVTINKKRKKDEDDFTSDRFKDQVAFNEVAHRPPAITALPRKAQGKAEDLSIARRPANKPGLLLTSLLEPVRRDLTLPRKQLSMSDRRQLDQAQTDAVQAYRQLKASKVSRTR